MSVEFDRGSPGKFDSGLLIGKLFIGGLGVYMFTSNALLIFKYPQGLGPFLQIELCKTGRMMLHDTRRCDIRYDITGHKRYGTMTCGAMCCYTMLYIYIYIYTHTHMYTYIYIWKYIYIYI